MLLLRTKYQLINAIQLLPEVAILTCSEKTVSYELGRNLRKCLEILAKTMAMNKFNSFLTCDFTNNDLFQN